MPYLETKDGVRLFYNDWGSGQPVVLIHGWPLDATHLCHAVAWLLVHSYGQCARRSPIGSHRKSLLALKKRQRT